MSANVPVATQDKIAAVLSPGQVVGGKYRVERLLAEGGMAAVWAGTNERTGKQVALKVILPIFARVPEAMELFRREALAASTVNHPNVVNIFDVIEHEGMTCIVMELLEGETLEAYLREHGPVDLTEATALLLPAMRGVAAANARGVVHRDLKPGNLFLCKDPQGRLLTTKVLDFGISMSAERFVDLASVSGAQPVRFGTPAYMAPEDIEYPNTVDGRTDVYGFGVLLFEVLAGKVPFPGEPSQELLTRILEEDPPRIAGHRSDLPSVVQDILDRTLAKDPGDRFPDVDHLIRVMEDHLLPRLPLPSSLSPIAGTALLSRDPSTHAWPSSDTEKAARNRSPVVRRGETRILFSKLGGKAASVESTAPPQWPSGPVTKRGWRGLGLRTKLEKRVAAAVSLAAILIVAPWIALHRGMANIDKSRWTKAGLSGSLHGPVVTPLVVEPQPSMPPPAADPGIPQRALQTPTPVPANPPAAIAPLAMRPAPVRAEVGGRKPSKAKTIERPRPRSRRTNPTLGGSTLSASDF
jgi:eukaryotic-like serine/threonine-protein kinase